MTDQEKWESAKIANMRNQKVNIIRDPIDIKRLKSNIINNYMLTFNWNKMTNEGKMNKYFLIGKEPNAGNNWGQEEKRVTEDEIVGWPHWLNGQESEQTLGDSERQGSLMCYSSWGCKESDTTEQLNKNNKVQLTITGTRWNIKVEWLYVD